ncbi:MAG: hypothetical protein RLY97_657 [Pseudomonadota bacterium]
MPKSNPTPNPNPTGTILNDVQRTEQVLLDELRSIRRQQRQSAPSVNKPRPMTFGNRLADGFAATMGSWRFIIIQSILLSIWVTLNITAWIRAWDPYPFILLNLVLSFQAAYAAPIIMMSQNRQQDIDRAAAENDYKINVKAELEIELLHQKLDQLRDQEILALGTAITALTELLTQQNTAPLAKS